MSEVKVNKVSPRSGTTVTIGDSGDTINIVGTLQNNGSALTGDISSVVAGTGLSGGATSGVATLNIEAAQPTITSLGTITGFTSTGIDDNATSTAITIDSAENVGIGNTTPNNFNASARQLVVGSGSGDNGITIFAGNANNSSLFLADGTVGTNGFRGSVNYLHNGDALTLHANATETMRLTNGNVGIGNTVMSSFSNLPATNLVVGAGTTDSGITIFSGTSSGSNIGFADATSGDGRNQGIIQYHHNGDYMRFFTSASERMRINSTGLGIGTTNPSRPLHVVGADGNLALFSNNVDADLNFTTGSGVMLISPSTNKLAFGISSTEKMRLTSTGLGINETSPLGLLHVKTADSGASVNSGHSQVIAENSGNSGMSILSGNASNGAVCFGDDGNNCIGYINYTHNGNHLDFGVDGSEKMRIASNGHVGIGTSTTSFALNVANGSGNMRIKTTDSANLANAATSIVEFHGTNNRGGYVGFVGGDMFLHTDTHSAGDIYLQTNGTQRMRIDSSGQVSIGSTSTNARLFVESNNDSISTFRLNDTSSGSGGKNIAIFQRRGTNVGFINVTDSSTSFVTSSDYRLKENVVDMTNATTRLKQLSPKRFNFIVDADKTVDGFLAHEVSSVVPEAISGEKDAVDNDGNPKYQGIDQSKLVPLLVKTIQELEARITQLENA